MPEPLPEAVFLPDGDRCVPTPIARGPWSPQALHGGAPAALLARAVERVDGPPFVARLTIELLRPVPMVPLEVRTEVVRPGKRVQLVAASLLADGVEVVRALALRIRELPVDVSDAVLPTDAKPAGPEGVRAVTPPEPTADGTDPLWLTFIRAFELRIDVDFRKVAGPAVGWFRLRVPIVAGEEPTPLQRVVAAADFGNGISAAMPWGEHLFINPDLTISLHRYPVGEWVCLDARTYPEDHGVALAESALFDERGRIGRAVQILLLEELSANAS